jgi:F-type H+-transporting ATPase subunit delta
MAQPLTIARPYARAAFDLAAATGTQDEWARQLAFAAEVAATPAVTALYGDPRVSATALASLFVRAEAPRESAFAHFIAVLVDNHRLRELPEIAALFEQLKRAAEHVLQVRVKSAVPMDDAEAARLKDALQRRFHSDIELERSVDPAILGGAIIDAGETVIDGSLKSRLAKLETALTN